MRRIVEERDASDVASDHPRHGGRYGARGCGEHGKRRRSTTVDDGKVGKCVNKVCAICSFKEILVFRHRVRHVDRIIISPLHMFFQATRKNGP